MTGRPNKNLVLAAMVFAVAMTFIDQTIVAIAIPHIQKELKLTGTRWDIRISAVRESISRLRALVAAE